MDKQLGAPGRAGQIGRGAVFLCAVFWSTGGLCIKLIDWHPISIAGGRSLIAALFMAAARFLSPQTRRRKFDLRLLWPAGLAYAATMILFVIANKLTASANAILLQYSAPIWAALLGWLLLREKLHWEQWGALILVTGGLVLFFKDSLASGSLAGDVIALISGIAFGANSVLMRMQRGGTQSDAFILAHLITALFSVPFFSFYAPAMSPTALGAILFLGVFQIGAASLLFAYGIARITAVQAMITAMAEPVLNPLWVLLATGEKPTPSALAGGGIIVAAVVGSSLLSKKREGP
ncbi:MAG: DMT family transporter [Treponema sp.]|jgi:drug/metabolite transporter (DMT)-like permease|nr:DMT family transporter [Treponema sp.]